MAAERAAVISVARHRGDDSRRRVNSAYAVIADIGNEEIARRIERNVARIVQPRLSRRASVTAEPEVVGRVATGNRRDEIGVNINFANDVIGNISDV